MMRSTATILCSLLASLATASCPAATYTYKASAPPGAIDDSTLQETQASADAWNVILDGDLPNPDFSGTYDFRGDSANNGDGGTSGAGAGDHAWGLHGPSTGHFVSAFASITSLIGAPLSQAGESVSLQFDNGSLYRPANGQGDSGAVGINFYEFDSNNVPRVQTSFAIFGSTAAPTYEIDDITTSDQTSPLDTGIPLTFAGFNVKLTLLDDAGHYELNVGDNYNSGQRLLIEGVSSIAAIEVLTAANGSDPMGSGPKYDTFFNSLVISTVPEASSAVTIPSAVAIVGLFVGAGRLRRRTARRARSTAVNGG